MALNGIIGLGKMEDWNSHQIEHALSGIYDTPHGAGLSIVFPAWMKYVYKNGISKFKRYAINVWNVEQESKTDEEIALEGIEKTKAYFSKMGAPVSLAEMNIPEEDIERIAKTAMMPGSGSYMEIGTKEAEEILRLAIK